jgi:hypothetical protein
MIRIRSTVLAVLASVVCAGPLIAQEGRQKLGYGRLITNDLLGDGKDRWRTGAYQSSRTYAPDWTGSAPGAFGELLEFRFRGEVLAPANIVTPAANDRRYAAAMSLGAHTHWSKGAYTFQTGLDLVITGPQNGIGEFQQSLHEALDVAGPDILATQLGDGVHPTLSFSTTREISLGESRLRPFVELRAGDETLVRAGADLLFGDFGKTGLLVRDVGTGLPYDTVRHSRVPGWSGLVGADVAYVWDSIYLRPFDGVTLEDTRARVRAGFEWQGDALNVFYGVSYLTEEFAAQTEGQGIGAIRLQWQF